MVAEETPYDAPMLQRIASNTTIGVVGFLCRSFLYGFSRTEVHGLEGFIQLVDDRKDAVGRGRGLITGDY